AYLKVIKFDEETNSTITLSNASFKIKNTDTGQYVKQWVMYPILHQVETFTTSSDGSFMTPKEMPVGNYALEEVKSPEGYLLSKDPIPFVI
ncbi:prealbumin-like fold domain-containing protein, partial [Gordonibacter pamelaeae]